MIDPYKEKTLQRLKKVRGQVDGVIKMVEEGKYCIQIVTQILALQGAIKKLTPVVLESHLNTCGEKLSSKNEEEKQKFIKELVKACELTGR